MDDLASHYTGLKVTITGADGFIGSHLTELLLGLGAEVRALVQYNSFNNLGWLEGVAHDRLEVVSGDIRDPFFCNTLVAGSDTVFHLAALIAIPYSYAAPESYVATNVNGTLNIAQACRAHKVRRLLHVSTSEVYGTARYVPIDEAHACQPQSPYSASKIGADAMAMSFHNAFDLGVTIARPFNTYGPRQSARAVIPTIISQILSGQPVLTLGDVRPTRDFNFVTDTCRGMALLAASEKTVGRTVNIGSNSEISVLEVARNVKDITSSAIEIVHDEARLRPEKSEVFRLVCDNSLIKQLTGYEPQMSLADGLAQTIQWFSDPANLARYKPGTYNV